MVSRSIVAGIAGLLLIAPAAAQTASQGAVALLVGQEVCPAGLVPDSRLTSALELSALSSDVAFESHIVQLAVRALEAKERLLANGSVDAFCRDLRDFLARPTSGN